MRQCVPQSGHERMAAWLAKGLAMVAVLLGVCVHGAAWGQPCGEQWLPGDGVLGVNGTVRALAVLPNGDLIAGGDFADGVIAYGGRQLGGDQLATFDQEAARLLVAAGEPVHLLR